MNGDDIVTQYLVVDPASGRILNRYASQAGATARAKRLTLRMGPLQVERRTYLLESKAVVREAAEGHATMPKAR